MAAWWWALSFHNSANTNIVFDEPCLNSSDVPHSFAFTFRTLFLLLILFLRCVCICARALTSIALSFVLSFHGFFVLLFFCLICVFHLGSVIFSFMWTLPILCAMLNHSSAANGQGKPSSNTHTKTRARALTSNTESVKISKKDIQFQRKSVKWSTQKWKWNRKTNWMENDADTFSHYKIASQDDEKKVNEWTNERMKERKGTKKEKWENILLLRSLCS